MKLHQQFAINKSFFFLMLTQLFLGCASLPANSNSVESFALTNTAETALASKVNQLVAAHVGQSGFYPLAGGLGAFAARLSLVENAEKTLDLQYYIWHDDLTGKALYHELITAADRGVRVRLLLDDLDTAGKDKMLSIINAHPNIEIRLFNPFANRNYRILDVFKSASRLNHRMHNKAIVADNQAAIFGGRNIGDEYFLATKDVDFADLDMLAIGPVVDEISESFDLYWNSKWAYPLESFIETTTVTQQTIDAFDQESQAFIDTAVSSDYAKALRELGIKNAEDVLEHDFTWGKWKLVYDQPGKLEYPEVHQDTHLAPALLEAMKASSSEIIIVSPYFVPDTDFVNFLISKVNDGVRVRIMTNSLAANDVALVHAGYRRYRKALIKGGIELYEYKADMTELRRQEEIQGKKISWTGSSKASLHGKFLGFDKRYLFVGSFNLDRRSVALNTELGVFFESPKFAKFLSESFDKNAIVAGYHVTLDGGDLRWSTVKNEQQIVFYTEPDAGFLLRLYTGIMSFLVPEDQL